MIYYTTNLVLTAGIIAIEVKKPMADHDILYMTHSAKGWYADPQGKNRAKHYQRFVKKEEAIYDAEEIRLDKIRLYKQFLAKFENRSFLTLLP